MDRTRYNFWIDDRQRAGLRRIKERDGVSESEQIRRAIDEWLTTRGEPKPRAGRTTPATGARRGRTRT